MMTAIMVDSNVLLDLMTEDTRWLSWSAEAIEKAADRFRLVINPIIYAEVAIRYSRIEDLEAALPKAMLDREATPMRPRSSRGSVLWFIGNEGERSNHRFRTFYRRPRGGCRVSAADPRCCALSQLLSEAAVDRP